MNKPPLSERVQDFFLVLVTSILVVGTTVFAYLCGYLIFASDFYAVQVALVFVFVFIICPLAWQPFLSLLGRLFGQDILNASVLLCRFAKIVFVTGIVAAVCVLGWSSFWEMIFPESALLRPPKPLLPLRSLWTDRFWHFFLTWDVFLLITLTHLGLRDVSK